MCRLSVPVSVMQSEGVCISVWSQSLLTGTSLDHEVHLKAIWGWGIQRVVSKKVIVNKQERERGMRVSKQEHVRLPILPLECVCHSITLLLVIHGHPSVND